MTQVREYDPRYPLLTRIKDPNATIRSPIVDQTPPQDVTYQTTIQNTQPTYIPAKKDNTALIIIIIVAVVIVLIVIGVLVYFFVFKKAGSTTTNKAAATGSLNDPCSSTSPCLPLFVCENSVCKSINDGPCQATSDCSQSVYGQVCTNNQCRRPNGEPCGSPGNCATNYCTPGGLCAACTATSQCQPSQNCSGGICK
jgi:hypothetical protein